MGGRPRTAHSGHTAAAALACVRLFRYVRTNGHPFATALCHFQQMNEFLRGPIRTRSLDAVTLPRGETARRPAGTAPARARAASPSSLWERVGRRARRRRAGLAPSGAAMWTSAALLEILSRSTESGDRSRRPARRAARRGQRHDLGVAARRVEQVEPRDQRRALGARARGRARGRPGTRPPRRARARHPVMVMARGTHRSAPVASCRRADGTRVGGVAMRERCGGGVAARRAPRARWRTGGGGGGSSERCAALLSTGGVPQAAATGGGRRAARRARTGRSAARAHRRRRRRATRRLMVVRLLREHGSPSSGSHAPQRRRLARAAAPAGPTRPSPWHCAAARFAMSCLLYRRRHRRAGARRTARAVRRPRWAASCTPTRPRGVNAPPSENDGRRCRSGRPPPSRGSG